MCINYSKGMCIGLKIQEYIYSCIVSKKSFVGWNDGKYSWTNYIIANIRILSRVIFFFKKRNQDSLLEVKLNIKVWKKILPKPVLRQIFTWFDKRNSINDWFFNVLRTISVITGPVKRFDSALTVFNVEFASISSART
jgi:hypothetical protein